MGANEVGPCRLLLRVSAVSAGLASGLSLLGQRPHQFIESLICNMLVFINTVLSEQILLALYMV